MRSCPTCDYLLEHDVSTCRFCGTNLRAADAAAAEAAKQAEVVALAAPRQSALTTSVIAALAIGAVIVVVVGWFTLARGTDQPAGASAPTAHRAGSPTTAPDPTTTAAATPATTAPSGYTLFGVPHASANVELPSGARVGAVEGGDLVKVDLGDGVGLGIGSADELPLSDSAAGLLSSLQRQATIELGGTQDTFSGLHVVANPAGPAVAYTYRLADGTHGTGTMVLINRTPVLVELVETNGSTPNALQLAIYAHAVGSITPVL